MDIPSDVINAVKETKQDLAEKPRQRAPHKRNAQKRVLHAVGNGLRTAEAISNALNITNMVASNALYALAKKGLLYATKKAGSRHNKYYLTTEKPTLGTDDLTVKPKRKVKARKPKKMVISRTDVIKAKVINKVNNELTAEQAKTIVQMQQRLTALEQSLVEKEKEVWTLECEVFDKKAIIKYLEEKLFVLGVRV